MGGGRTTATYTADPVGSLIYIRPMIYGAYLYFSFDQALSVLLFASALLFCAIDHKSGPITVGFMHILPLCLLNNS